MVQATKLIRKIERRRPAKKLSDLVKFVVTCSQSQQSTTILFSPVKRLPYPTMKVLPLLDTSEIMAYTGARKSTIERVARCYKFTGKPGRTRMMDLEDIEYMHGHLSRSCDMYLDELRDEISQARGKHLSLSTIWRTLHRTGYSRKKVSVLTLQLL
ncbi:uncharacterized protein F5891DRAFT_1015576 [Suillus fuscotomentosus]|uniref:Winged helix-turn helix domain-containing protein n=1 Tax=Suillus fuscotomentosus TaxID=1912939 RepID=A0AAD4ECY2_9AGAM|nr:uncharacterized protein F5891DRAFT_1015576 [Suillus fuscotomentosus]KAG1903862.1 hypothetical protein F5891DRAFT_1015576 [Suillus fuscotomentosus]